MPDLAELLARATERAVLGGGAGKSGATLERVVIDGEPYVLKHPDRAKDWSMRASGCLPGPPLVLWERGILARLPACFNQPIVAAAAEPGHGTYRPSAPHGWSGSGGHRLATSVSTSYLATDAPSWLVTSVSQRTSP